MSKQMSTNANTFKELITNKKLVVPDYQRAYAWGEKQVEDFVNDLKIFSGDPQKQYYFGHFIIEKNKDFYEIVDGQQRITLAILFLCIARKFLDNKWNSEYVKIINNFTTVTYDKTDFEKIINSELDSILKNSNKKIKETLKNEKSIFSSYKTQSLHKIIETLTILGNKLKKEKIEDLLQTLMRALVSVHETNTKAVAVQIFELHNSRGIQLNVIEKVKAKLMQHVYVHASDKNLVNKIQSNFANIYKLENELKICSFKNELTLEQLLHLHLRVVDDGINKQYSNGDNVLMFDKPNLSGNREEVIMSYLNEKLSKVNVNYVIDLSSEFEKSVRIICNDLPEWDKVNNIIGDIFILDRDRSIEFTLIICRQDKEVNYELFSLWERLLFTWDFHDLYNGIWRRNRIKFPELFAKLTNLSNDIKSKIESIEKYVKDGFYPERTKQLQKKVRRFIANYKSQIITDVLNWPFNLHKDKIQYLLYKYEKSLQKCNIDLLRKHIKINNSIEHVLPRNWKSINEIQKKIELVESFEGKIDTCINGIGNLLILNSSDNSRLSDKHPINKIYPVIGPSYKLNREEWENPKKWESLLLNRGKKIYNFLIEKFLEGNYYIK